jgi:hypothetical protein
MADDQIHSTVPPDSVEMPEPTIAPLVLAVGVGLIGLGVATTLAFSVVGALLLLVGLGTWIARLLPGQGHMHEPLAPPAERAVPVAPRPGTVQGLKPGVAGYRFQVPLEVHPISAGIKGGLIGGAVMPIPALAYGIFSGHGIWFPVNLLVGMILPGTEAADVKQLEAFNFWALLFGAVIHVVMSVGIGTMYGVLTPALPGPGGPLVWGGIITPLMWTLASFGFMGVINPLLQQYVDWFWFILSQLVYGLVAAAVIVRTEKVAVPPRGPGEDRSPEAPERLDHGNA